MDGLTLHQKLLKIRESVTSVNKDAKGSQYAYVSSANVLNSLRKNMDDNGVLLIPQIHSVNVREKTEEKQGGKFTITYFTELKMTMTWVDVDNPTDKIVCEWYAQGVDIAGEKGVGKALTYGEKYFLLKFFNISTDSDDPDNQQHTKTHQQEEDEEPLSIMKLDEALLKITATINATDLENLRKLLNTYKWTTQEKLVLKGAIENHVTDLMKIPM